MRRLLGLVELAVQMLVDAPLKSLGTLVGVIVSVFLMAQQLSLRMGILSRVAAFADNTDADIWIASPSTESLDATDSVPMRRVSEALGTRGVAWAAPLVQGFGRVTRPDGVRELVKVIGVEAPRYAGLPRTLEPGSREALRAPGRLLLNSNDKGTFADPRLGDRIEISGQIGIVAGFFQGMDPHSPYYFVYSNIDDARAFTGFPQDRTTLVAVGVEPNQNIEAVASRLKARLPEVLVVQRDELRAMEIRYFLVRTPVGVVFGMGTVVAALIGAAIVAVTLYSTVTDRVRDYGTLKAIGARKIDLFQLLLAQAWMFFGAGYLIGISAFMLLRHLLPQLPMLAPWEMLVGVALASLVSCTLASLAAIRRVLVLDPAIVFRG